METADTKEKEVLKRTFGKIILTLENAILSVEKLENPTVSQEDGLSREIELDLRILGCELIQTAGILLKLPQVSTIWRKNWIFTPSGSFSRAPYCKNFPYNVSCDVKVNDYNRWMVEFAKLKYICLF